jgi:hypothetical protein
MYQSRAFSKSGTEYDRWFVAIVLNGPLRVYVLAHFMRGPSWEAAASPCWA